LADSKESLTMQSKKTLHKAGFTLLEVLVVVVIAVTVTMFSVPAYKKSQARAQYMTASGVLIELATATQMLMESYPNLVISSAAFNTNETTDATDPTNSTAAKWMRGQNYLAKVNFNSNGTYMGYTYSFSTQGTAACGEECTKDGAIACMANGSHMIDVYQCAWISMDDGLLHNLEN